MVAGDFLDLVGKDLTGFEVLELDVVDATTARVGGKRHDLLVAASFARVQAEELVSSGHGRNIEHDFFPGRAQPTPAAQGIGVALAIAAVVFVVLFTVGHGGVVLHDAPHDLLEEGLLQRVGFLEDGPGIGILRFKVGDHLRVLPLLQPVVGIDAGVSVGSDDAVWNTPGIRRPEVSRQCGVEGEHDYCRKQAGTLHDGTVGERMESYNP